MSTVTHEPVRDAAAIEISLGDDIAAANEALEDVRLDDYFGRRIEEDRTWTIYHVYTGVPAFSDGMGMTGLSRTDATRGMRLLNSRHAEHRAHREKQQAVQHNRLSTFLRAAWRKTAGLPWH